MTFHFPFILRCRCFSPVNSSEFSDIGIDRKHLTITALQVPTWPRCHYHMCKLVHSCGCCHHFSGIMCTVGTSCAGFNCHVKCLRKDYTMIQHGKENKLTVYSERWGDRVGERHRLVICEVKIHDGRNACNSIFSWGTNQVLYHLATQSMVHRPAASPGRLIEMPNFRLCPKPTESGSAF